MNVLFICGVICIAVAIVVAIIWQGIREIPASPPYVALVTLFKKPINYVKSSGYRFFFGYPYIFGYIPIKIEKINDDDLEGKDLSITVRTPHPDNVEVKIDIHFTFQPDYHSPEALMNYIESGQANGVGEIFVGIIEQEIREWAASQDRGPKNWQELISSDEEVTSVIIDAIIASELGQLDSVHFPPSVLIKYFKHKSPSKIEAEKYGEHWEKVTECLESRSEEEQRELGKKIIERTQEIARIRDANGFFNKPSLGIIVNRLNIGEIRLLHDDLIQAAEMQAKEERERDGERVELQHVQDSIKKLVDSGLSREQAIEIFQTERGKAGKNINEHKITVSGETQKMLTDMIPFIPFLKPKVSQVGKKKGGDAV
ncbi:MAG: SPFH domain-containing protein [bacterium]